MSLSAWCGDQERIKDADEMKDLRDENEALADEMEALREINVNDRMFGVTVVLSDCFC